MVNLTHRPKVKSNENQSDHEIQNKATDEERAENEPDDCSSFEQIVKNKSACVLGLLLFSRRRLCISHSIYRV